ncbi:hypothetical protein [Bradyrhizobium sp. CB1015]|uniref:hypothetical protein n=1 Tax=Bradyrhizobium sp. CB1015 TaxID=2976822 RepID=UPI0021AB054F|nr:hypothetical protein [Bradyrhizobium sp. CB1015]UWU90741.1 hypothetical protein N2604_30380 [Bradyrhizobium sp. CB1015]
MDLLRFGKLRIVGGEHLLQVRKLAVALAEVICERKTRLLALASAMAVRWSATGRWSK